MYSRELKVVKARTAITKINAIILLLADLVRDLEAYIEDENYDSMAIQEKGLAAFKAVSKHADYLFKLASSFLAPRINQKRF